MPDPTLTRPDATAEDPLLSAEVEATTLPALVSPSDGVVDARGDSSSSRPATKEASSSPEKFGPVVEGMARVMRPGDWIGGVYRIDGKLGGGAMGQVFSAFDDALERRVAIKLIRANLQVVDFRTC